MVNSNDVKVSKRTKVNRWKPNRIELVEKKVLGDQREIYISEVAQILFSMKELFNNSLEAYE